MSRVKSVRYNWHQEGYLDDRNGVGEQFSIVVVGENKVVSIEENEPKNGNQLWNFLVRYEDGSMIRVFNPNQVEYFK